MSSRHAGPTTCTATGPCGTAGKQVAGVVTCTDPLTGEVSPVAGCGVRLTCPGLADETLVYTDDTGAASMMHVSALPGDVNGDRYTGVGDVLELIDALNLAAYPPWGNYGTDIDQSGAFNAADVLGLIDLLNGAGVFAPWNNERLPVASGGCP